MIFLVLILAGCALAWHSYNSEMGSIATISEIRDDTYQHTRWRWYRGAGYALMLGGFVGGFMMIGD